MTYYRECIDCKEKKAKGRIFVFPNSTYSTDYPLCDDCLTIRIRKKNPYGVMTITEEIKEINTLVTYLSSQNHELLIPYEDIFRWITNENWIDMSKFRLSLGKIAFNLIRRDMMQFLSRFESIPSKSLSSDQFKNVRQFVRSKKKLIESIPLEGRNVVHWIDKIQRNKKSSLDLLEELNHSWEKYKDLHMQEVTISLKGIVAFISGRSKDLEEDRNAAKEYLQRFDLKVLRFEDIASPNSIQDACYDMVDAAQFYIGIYGSSYGNIVDKDRSATELEFDKATEAEKIRLIFIKDTEAEEKQILFIKKLQKWKGKESVLYKKYNTISDLVSALNDSLSELIRKKVIR